MDSQVMSNRQLHRRRFSLAKLDEVIEEATVDAMTVASV
jgi:hypothetical protein